MSERDGGAGDRARAEARIEAALGQLGAELSPPAGWQARVLAAGAEAAAPRRRWWWIALPALAVAAAAALALWLGVRNSDAPGVQLALSIERTGAVVRGAEASTGDTLTAAARGDGPHRAVWLFRDGRELILACPGPASAACRASADALTATATLQLPGTYTVVAVTSRAPIPPPAASLDAAVSAAGEAGAALRTETVKVR